MRAYGDTQPRTTIGEMDAEFLACPFEANDLTHTARTGMYKYCKFQRGEKTNADGTTTPRYVTQWMYLHCTREEVMASMMIFAREYLEHNWGVRFKRKMDFRLTQIMFHRRALYTEVLECAINICLDQIVTEILNWGLVEVGFNHNTTLAAQLNDHNTQQLAILCMSPACRYRRFAETGSMCRGSRVLCYSSICRMKNAGSVLVPVAEFEGFISGQTDFAAAIEHRTGIELTCQHPESNNNNVWVLNHSPFTTLTSSLPSTSLVRKKREKAHITRVIERRTIVVFVLSRHKHNAAYYANVRREVDK